MHPRHMVDLNASSTLASLLRTRRTTRRSTVWVTDMEICHFIPRVSSHVFLSPAPETLSHSLTAVSLCRPLVYPTSIATTPAPSE